MSSVPSGTSVPSIRVIARWTSRARLTPRRWMPMSTTSSVPWLRSITSWAMRASARFMSALSRSCDFSRICMANVPDWILGAGSGVGTGSAVASGQKKTRYASEDVRVRAAIPRFGPVHGATPSGPHGIRLKVSDTGRRRRRRWRDLSHSGALRQAMSRNRASTARPEAAQVLPGLVGQGAGGVTLEIGLPGGRRLVDPPGPLQGQRVGPAGAQELRIEGQGAFERTEGAGVVATVHVGGGEAVEGVGIVGAFVHHAPQLLGGSPGFAQTDQDQAQVVARVDVVRGAIQGPLEGLAGFDPAAALLHGLDAGVVRTARRGDGADEFEVLAAHVDPHPLAGHRRRIGRAAVVPRDALGVAAVPVDPRADRVPRVAGADLERGAAGHGWLLVGRIGRGQTPGGIGAARDEAEHQGDGHEDETRHAARLPRSGSGRNPALRVR